MKFNIFELGIFSFNLCFYYLIRAFTASTRAFNLLTRAFNFATRAFSPLTRGFELVTREFELVTRGFQLVTGGFELVTRGFQLVTRNSCFTFPLNTPLINYLSVLTLKSMFSFKLLPFDFSLKETLTLKPLQFYLR